MKKIGIYAGSFNPFHVGHSNILVKAKYIFDEVIVAFGVNPSKIDFTKSSTENEIEKRIAEFKKVIPNQKIEYYIGFLPDYVRTKIKKDTHVTIIRGLRDEYDLAYETKQIRFMQDMMPEISVIEILCDKEFSHISSSSIRDIAKLESYLNTGVGVKDYNPVNYMSKYIKL